jgi:ferredoxin
LAKLFIPLYNFLTRVFGHSQNPDQGGTTFADTYHGKVVPTQAAGELVKVEEDISLTDLEPIIPYARAKDIVMKNPDYIVVLDCPCRNARQDPCLPLDVCLIIGEPFASFVLEHHPHRSRVISSQEAVQILEEEHQRGHVHHAFFKDAMLERFYAICNCCSCCCGAMQAQRNGTMMLTSSGYVAQIDHGECIACGVCADLCPFEAIHMEGESPHISDEDCMGCGVCAGHCEVEAIELLLAPGKGEPLSIQALIEEKRGISLS